MSSTITNDFIYTCLNRGYGFTFDYKEHHYDLIGFKFLDEKSGFYIPNLWLFEDGVCSEKNQYNYVDQLRVMKIDNEFVTDVIKSIDSDKLIVGTTFNSLMQEAERNFKKE